MLYNIIFIDSGSFSELPPTVRTIEANDEEIIKIREKIEKFNNSRQPYFYPQMYIYKITYEMVNDIMDYIDEEEYHVIKWIDKQNEYKIKREKLLSKY